MGVWPLWMRGASPHLALCTHTVGMEGGEDGPRARHCFCSLGRGGFFFFFSLVLLVAVFVCALALVYSCTLVIVAVVVGAVLQ